MDRFLGVSIALERSGEVVLGVVYDPMGEETFVAERGRGATLNGQPIKVSNTGELIRALIATGFPYERAEMPEALELFGRLAASTRGMRRLGSAALDLCYVAAGRLDGYYERGISWADQYRASRAIPSRHNVLGKAYGWSRPLNLVYLLHLAPTTSIPLNPLGARGWQVVLALV